MNIFDDNPFADAEQHQRNVGVLKCDGQRHSNIRTGELYGTIDWNGILEMVVSPASVPKDMAPAIIPSSYVGHDGRSHAVQREFGSFIFLAGDVDAGNPSKDQLMEALRGVVGHCDMAVYSTASAAAEDKRWRFVLLLAEPAPGECYSEIQEALFDLLGEYGICLDRSLARTGQLLFLPNVPPSRRGSDGEPLFYDCAIVSGRPLDIIMTGIPKRIEARRAEEARKLELLKTAAEERRAQRNAANVNTDEVSLIDAFNTANTVEECLLRYGYETDGRGNWRSPYQAGGTFGTKVYEGTWFSLSWSDEDAGLGTRSAKRSGVFGDSYSLFVHFEHGGDHRAAFRQLGRERWQSTGRGWGEYDLEQQRREQQRAENKDIGAEVPLSTMPTYLDLGEALGRFAFATKGSRVIDLRCPTREFALPDFRNAFAASRMTTQARGRDGELVERDVPTTALWLANEKRHTVHSTTFRPGAETFTTDPLGHPCANTWLPFQRGSNSDDYERNVAVFLEHIELLFGGDADRFLDWLGHIEQKPGVLPHTAWLHISTRTGTGRNALSSIFTRVWRGRVAAGFDLTRCLGSGFNGELAGKLMAVVDEIREGGDEWAHSETLKRLITEEQRLINHKYGTQALEYNCCRFLLFSNHISAIPLDRTDRRFEVVIYGGFPQPESYYSRLYSAVSSHSFINDIALLLGRRDLRTFNAGRHAQSSAAKGRVMEVSTSEGSVYGQTVADHWPADVIPSAVLSAIIHPGSGGGMTAHVRRVMSEFGMRPYPKSVWTGSKNQRVTIVRHAEQWLQAKPNELGTELQRGMPSNDSIGQDWREYIDMLAAR